VGISERHVAVRDAEMSLSPGDSAVYTKREFVVTPVIDAERPVATDRSVPLAKSRRTLREIFALSVPALGSTLADPLCSLADTALVGQVSALQLASLGPHTALFNFVFLVRLYSLYRDDDLAGKPPVHMTKRTRPAPLRMNYQKAFSESMQKAQ
jgi:hypothetical protein